MGLSVLPLRATTIATSYISIEAILAAASPTVERHDGYSWQTGRSRAEVAYQVIVASVASVAFVPSALCAVGNATCAVAAGDDAGTLMAMATLMLIVMLL